MIEIKSLVKNYKIAENVVQALRSVNLTVDVGEMLAIMGPSGSGKSTLMNILGCLDRPDSGQYLLEGRDVSKMKKDALAEVRSKRIGFVFQNFYLLPRMTALENVELPMLYANLPNSKERARNAMEIVKLADRMEHEPNQLSGGQRQRVAIARSIVNDPAIILADEPTGNLDTKTGDEILAIFESLNQQGRTIIVVTHEPDVAKHCKRQIHLRDGQIVEDFRS